MGVPISHGKGHFWKEKMYRPTVTYIRVSALRIVRLQAPTADECIRRREAWQDKPKIIERWVREGDAAFWQIIFNTSLDDNCFRQL